MRNQSRKVGITPRTALDSAVRFPFIYLPMHGSTYGTDTATQVKDRAYAVDNQSSDGPFFTSGLITCGGTTTNIWSANAGLFTPPGNGVIKDTSSAVRDFMRLDTLDDGGGILVLFRYVMGAIPSAAEYFISYSDLHAVGGYSLWLFTDGKIYCSYMPQGGSLTTVTRDDTALTAGTEYAYCLYLDCINRVAILYRNGIIQTSPNPMLRPLPSLNAANGFVIAGRSGAESTNKSNQNGSASRMGDIFVMRAPPDISGGISVIATEWYK